MSPCCPIPVVNTVFINGVLTSIGYTFIDFSITDKRNNPEPLRNGNLVAKVKGNALFIIPRSKFCTSCVFRTVYQHVKIYTPYGDVETESAKDILLTQSYGTSLEANLVVVIIYFGNGEYLGVCRKGPTKESNGKDNLFHAGS